MPSWLLTPESKKGVVTQLHTLGPLGKASQEGAQDHTQAALSLSHGKLWIQSTDKRGSVLNSERAVPQSRHLVEPTASHLHMSMDSMEKHRPAQPWAATGAVGSFSVQLCQP